MLFRKKKMPPEAEHMNQQADQIKAGIVKRSDKVTEDTDRLNKLLLANGITLRIFIATNGDKRHD